MAAVNQLLFSLASLTICSLSLKISLL